MGAMNASREPLGDPIPTVLIQPRHGWASLGLEELWHYRELLYFLVWRDVKVRYKQTVLGAAWAILQPLMTMLVFTIFFGKLAAVGSDGLPYQLFSYAGVLPWSFFAQGLSQAGNSILDSSRLISKVYFPRLTIPIAAVMGGLVDFAIAFVVLIGLMVYYGVVPSPAILFLPLILLLAIGAALGMGFWLGALNVQYRDIRYVIPFFIQLWLFVTPVIYPASRVTAKLKASGLPPWLLGLNPMAGVVEGFRWALLRSGAPPTQLLIPSTAVTVILLVTGGFYFRRMERTFADVV